jgi:hypothetical protein
MGVDWRLRGLKMKLSLARSQKFVARHTFTFARANIVATIMGSWLPL